MDEDEFWVITPKQKDEEKPSAGEIFGLRLFKAQEEAEVYLRVSLKGVSEELEARPLRVYFPGPDVPRQAPEQLHLGELIDLLAACDQEASVVFDFARVVPTNFDSYRGYYCHLALGWGKPKDKVLVRELLHAARCALETTFQGYKGGEFKMFTNTPVWASNYGDCDRYMIIGTRSDPGVVTLVTQKKEDF